jgi:hypothetical protein
MAVGSAPGQGHKKKSRPHLPRINRYPGDQHVSGRRFAKNRIDKPMEEIGQRIGALIPLLGRLLFGFGVVH